MSRNLDSELSPRIIGIVLVRDEDIFVRRAVTNILHFCDKVIVTDHRSTDRTSYILRELASEHDKIDYHLIDDMAISHELIRGYAGRKVWVFGVDGDEIYDPAGLAQFREVIQAGHYDDYWMIFGNVLNCIELDHERANARGYLAAPCRSMTKLYNFNAIDSWETSSGERLHGGDVSFRKGYDNSMRLCLHEKLSWAEAKFRCLHLCFLQRSSIQKKRRGRILPRPNPADIMTRNLAQRMLSSVRGLCGIPEQGKAEWKIEKFTRGELVDKDVSAFFPSFEHGGK
jgi:glycosyltransferase involved in cell wall biosynthesis